MNLEVRRGHGAWKWRRKQSQRERCPNCAKTNCGWNENGVCPDPPRAWNAREPYERRCHTCGETGHKAKYCRDADAIAERRKYDLAVLGLGAEEERPRGRCSREERRRKEKAGEEGGEEKKRRE